VVVEAPPDIIGVRSVDASLTIDKAVEMAVLLDEAKIVFAKPAPSDRSSACGHTLSSSFQCCQDTSS
ncbi:MAG: hypothetical protein OXH63_02465, partial [Gemmatimonadetes bacterium]|nr:hypothetical protein [Gemmatimonadota bacterium]